MVIIVTYNGMPWIQKCLDSCKGYQVIIVDNKSTDGTIAFIKEKYPEMHLMPQKENLGFGQANNIGIKYALEQRAEYVFLLNQDAYLVGDCLERLLTVQKKHPEFGIVSPVHLNGQGTFLDRNFSHYLRFDACKQFYSDYVLNKPIKEIYQLPFVNAAGWLLSKKCIEIVGGFDPIFFHYGEDDNYCQRVNYHGLKVGVIPNAFLKHDREYRETHKPEKNSPLYYERLARTYKLKYANVNLKNLDSLELEINQLKKTIVKLKIKLKFTAASQANKKFQIFKNLMEEVVDSRKRNIKKGFHYLKL